MHSQLIWPLPLEMVIRVYHFIVIPDLVMRYGTLTLEAINIRLMELIKDGIIVKPQYLK